MLMIYEMSGGFQENQEKDQEGGQDDIYHDEVETPVPSEPGNQGNQGILQAPLEAADGDPAMLGVGLLCDESVGCNFSYL